MGNFALAAPQDDTDQIPSQLYNHKSDTLFFR